MLEVVRHAGSRQMHGFIDLKLHDVRFGHFGDKRFKHANHVDGIELRKRQTEYLSSDIDSAYFTDPETFEQIRVPKTTIGPAEKFMKEGMQIPVELPDEEPPTAQFPKVVELKPTRLDPR